ncbi:MAG: ATPase domain-containing protein, partial [Pseudomonadota bacterium]
MAKTPNTYSCTACGATFNKWSGRCDACGEWNTIQQDKGISTGPSKSTLGGKRGASVQLTDLSTQEAPPPRSKAGIAELDRVLGGGLVPASAILVGGDPGIGKSTLLLQAAAHFAQSGLKTIYVSGEEASAQVRMRAQRLGLTAAPVQLAAETPFMAVSCCCCCCCCPGSSAAAAVDAVLMPAAADADMASA